MIYYGCLYFAGRHQLESDPFAPRFAAKPPRRELVRALLTEYYEAGSGYSAAAVEEMGRLARHRPGTGYTVRASLVAGAANTSALAGLLAATQDSFLVVVREPTDRETRADLSGLLEEVGRGRVLVSLPDPAPSRVPQPRNSESGAVTLLPATFVLLPATAVLLAATLL